MASKDLRRAIQGLGLYITGKEAKKVSGEFNVNPLLIAQLASKYATENKKTVSFSAKLASQLQKLAQGAMPRETSATLDGGNFFSMLANLQSSATLKNLGVSSDFARNLADVPKFDKGQMLTIGNRGEGAILPRDRNQGTVRGGRGGGGRNGQAGGQQVAGPSVDYAGMLGDFGGLGGGGGMTINLGSNDQEYMKQLQRQTNKMNRQLEKAITALSTPTQPAQVEAAPPMVIYGAGDNYNVEGVRAATRRPRRRTDYLRDAMSIQPQIASSLIGTNVGGITI